MSSKWNTGMLKGAASFGQEILDESGVIFMQGKNSFGDRIYCYVRITLRDLNRMHASIQKGQNFNPSDFGTVIAAGKGEPTAEVKSEIAATYNLIEPDKARPVAASVPQEQKKAWDDY